MGDDRVEITWDDLPDDGPTPPPAPPAAPRPSYPVGPHPGAPRPLGAPLPSAPLPGQGQGGLPPIAPRASPGFGYAAPAATRNSRPLIIGGVIIAAVLIAIVVNLAHPDEGGSLSRGSSRSGSVGLDDSVTFQIEGQSSTVGISVVGENGFDPTVSVEDSSGSSLGYDDDSGGSLDSYLDVYLEGGRSYSIIVEGFSGDSGDFRISVN